MSVFEWKLLPSVIESYYSHGYCLRSLALAGLKKNNKSIFGFTECKADYDDTSAVVKQGYQWEEKVIELIKKNFGADSIISKENYEKYKDYESLQEIINLYNKMNSPENENIRERRFYLYQIGLNIEKTFIKEYIKVDEEKIRGKFRFICKTTYPDLIRAEWDNEQKKLMLSVVDIKLAKKPKMEHKMQIGMYILILKDFVKRNKISDKVIINDTTAYLFNFGKNEETPFDARIVLDFLRSFLSKTIPEMVGYACSDAEDNKKYQKFPYHISQQCEWCTNYEKCIESCRETGEDIMLMPYISPYAQDYIRSLKEKNPELSFDCDNFRKYLTEDNFNVLNENIYWKSFLSEKDDRLDMLYDGLKGKTDNIRKRKRTSCDMPEFEDINIILSAQKDAGFDKCYYFGIKVSFLDSKYNIINNLISPKNCDHYIEVVETSKDNCSTYIGIFAKDMLYQHEAAREFISVWHRILHYADDKNRNNDTLSVQHYVMDNYEMKNIEETLMDIISDNTNIIFSDAADLMLVMQGKSLVESMEMSDRPKKTIDYPVIVLTNTVGSQFILPSLISNSFADVCNALVKKSELQNVNDEKYRIFQNKKSNVIRNDPVNDYWNSINTEEFEDNKYIPNYLTDYMKHRLSVEKLIIDSIREKRTPGNYGILEPFFLPKRSELKSPQFQKLMFEAQYEHKLKKQMIRSARTMNFEQAVEEGKLWILKTIDCKKQVYNYTVKFKIENYQSFFKDGLYNIAICKYDDKDILPFYDENKTNYNEIIKIWKADIVSEENDENIYIKTTLKDDIQIGSKYVMFETVSDMNLKANMKAIQKADEKITSAFPLDPKNFYGDVADKTRIPQKILDCFKGFDVQCRTLEHLYNKNLTLLLGPPGTGKTFFISKALLELIKYYETQGKPLKILVCANSHAAIENVLNKVCEMMTANTSALNVAKIGSMESNKYKGKIIEITDKYNLENFIFHNNKPLVIGSTVWQICSHFIDENHKKFICSNHKNKNFFDIIVIDEASQLRMIDAAIPLTLQELGTTRTLIVGDDYQLPPIISGNYNKNPDEDYLLGSVFKYYFDCHRHFENDPYIFALKDNFRMNRAISEYSAQKIYGDYGPANDIIGTQLLTELLPDIKTKSYIIKTINELYPNDTDNEIIADIIDSEYPLILCCVKGKTSADIKNNEVRYVSKIVKVMQKLFKDKKPGYSKNDFWGKDFGIVSPHHEHIKRLKSKIIEDKKHSSFDNENTNDLFIGTVDKLQGQEREIVVVSYGVTDIEQALTEDEFIFSRNRLNVAVTRAKKKCILFLSDAVLNYPIEALTVEDRDIIEGINYVCGFKDFMTPDNKEKSPVLKEYDDIFIYQKN